MSSKRSCWEVYNKQMSQLNNGDALWEPAPLHYFKRIYPGDVGYIRRGCFHLLFSAGRPLGERRLGVHVPRSFKQLQVGPIFNTQPRLPGHLSTNNVRETRARLAPSTSPDPILEPGSSFSFRLTEDQGATLVTKYLTHREDVQLAGTFEKYAKDHYDSWVTFARETGHGNDVKPVLVTGVDMTRDFAMMSYSNNDDTLTSEFTTSAPGAGSVWGTWRTTGPVNTNCGPYLSHPPSPTQTMDSSSSGTGHASTIPDEYNQCVFVRYYTVRKRLGIPRVIRAAAGPHDLGPGDRDNEESLLEEQYDSGSDSDSDSDTASSLFDDDDDDRSSVSSIESESDIVIHNTIPDERGDFDEVADYIFRNSDADSVLIHHRDIALLREPGSSRDLFTQLIEKRLQITVDENGVGTIRGKADPAANIQFGGSLEVTPPIPVFIPSEIEHKAKNRTASPEPQPPSLSERPSPSLRGYARKTTPNRHSFIAEEGTLPPTPILRHNRFSYDRGRFRGLEHSIPRMSLNSDGISQPRSNASTMPTILPALPTTRPLGFGGIPPYKTTPTMPSMMVAFPITKRPLGSGGISQPCPNTPTSHVEAPPSGAFLNPRKIPRPHYNFSPLFNAPLFGVPLGSSGVPRPRSRPSILPNVLAPLPKARPASVPAPPISYMAETAFDHRVKQRRSITFSTNGLPDVNMRDAGRKRFTDLKGRDDLVLQGAGYPSNRSTQVSTMGWREDHSLITRSEQSYKVFRVRRLLDLMGSCTADLPFVSKSYLRPETWVADPTLRTLSSFSVPRVTSTNGDQVQSGKEQLGSPPSLTVPASDPTITTSTTLGRPRAEHTAYRSLAPRSIAMADWTGYDMKVHNGQNSIQPPGFLLSPRPLDRDQR